MNTNMSSSSSSSTRTRTNPGLPQKGQTRKSKKSVYFSPEESRVVLEIESLDDISREERLQVWFSRQEFADIKLSYREIILMMRKKELLVDTDELCTRGLECQSKAGSRRRRDTQLNGLRAVLGEQERQRGSSLCEPETLAIVYRQFSYHCQQAATNMGRRDEQAISEYALDLPAEYRVISVREQQIRTAAPVYFSAPRVRTSLPGFGGSATNSRVKVVTRGTANGLPIGSTSKRRVSAAA
jgi:hypothetical protein